MGKPRLRQTDWGCTSIRYTGENQDVLGLLGYIEECHCRLWSDGRDVSEIAHMTGRDRKTVRKYLQMDDFSPEASRPLNGPFVTHKSLSGSF